MNNMKRKKDMTPEDEPPTSEGVQYATGEKQKQCSIVDVPGGESKVRCCKE